MFPKQITSFILTEKLPSADVLNQKWFRSQRIGLDLA